MSPAAFPECKPAIPNAATVASAAFMTATNVTVARGKGIRHDRHAERDGGKDTKCSLHDSFRFVFAMRCMNLFPFVLDAVLSPPLAIELQ